MSRTLAILAVLMTALAGCLGASEDVTPATNTDVPADAVPSHVLAGAVEPADLAAPVFELLGALAKGGPAYGAGEPSIWAHTDGTIFVSFPGCDQGPYLVEVPGAGTCAHGLVYKSEDEGKSWTRLNRDGDGRLSEDGPAANGDADVAVDAAGTVYTANLGEGIQIHRSTDGGATWKHAANVVPEEHWADRQWIAAAGPGHVIATWMGGADADQRAVAVTTTHDGGDTWSEVLYLGEDIGWIGTVQFDPSGTRAFIPFTENRGGTQADADFLTGAPLPFQLLVARTLDGGATWEVVDTGVTIQGSGGMFGQWSGTLMAPALDVTGDGHVVYAWSEEVHSPVGAVGMGAVVRAVTSPDWGATWSAPLDVSEGPTAIMPWVTGGAGDRFAVTYFESMVPLEPDYTGRWNVVAAVVDGATNGTASVVRTVVDTDVHLGGLCSRGGACIITGSDRALLDFFESDLMPDGRLVLTYPADPVQGGKYIEIRVAIQNGGTPLLAPPEAAGTA